jgi:DNA-binding response OmpR family regulator
MSGNPNVRFRDVSRAAPAFASVDTAAMDLREPPAKVLLIEDDVRLATLTSRYLESHGVSVVVAHDGPSGVRAEAAGSFDVVLLDLNLPGLDGIRVCQKIRQRSSVPIVMLTARTEEADRVLGLEVGADDYVPKPFSSRELLARVRAQARRARGSVGPRAGVLTVGRLRIDPSARTATAGNVDLVLTTFEFDLLRALAERPGRVLSRETLLELLHGSSDTAFDRSIDVHVSRLRGKLGDDPRSPRMLKTVRGAGYVLAPGDGE